MAKLGTVDFTGKSGTTYTFTVYEIDTSFKKLGGVYFFTVREKKSGENGYTHVKKVYVGQTGDLPTRFDNHHKMACIERENANCICILSEPNETNRLEIETDLVGNYNPVCNG